MTSLPLATAATLYHRFFHHYNVDDFDPYVCIKCMYTVLVFPLYIVTAVFCLIYLPIFGIVKFVYYAVLWLHC